MTAVLIIVVLLIVPLIFAIGYVQSRCPADYKRRVAHDWLYFGPTERHDWSQYWDRQCQRCGLFD